MNAPSYAAATCILPTHVSTRHLPRPTSITSSSTTIPSGWSVFSEELVPQSVQMVTDTRSTSPNHQQRHDESNRQESTTMDSLFSWPRRSSDHWRTIQQRMQSTKLQLQKVSIRNYSINHSSKDVLARIASRIFTDCSCDKDCVVDDCSEVPIQQGVGGGLFWSKDEKCRVGLTE